MNHETHTFLPHGEGVETRESLQPCVWHLTGTDGKQYEARYEKTHLIILLEGEETQTRISLPPETGTVLDLLQTHQGWAAYKMIQDQLPQARELKDIIRLFNRRIDKATEGTIPRFFASMHSLPGEPGIPGLYVLDATISPSDRVAQLQKYIAQHIYEQQSTHTTEEEQVSEPLRTEPVLYVSREQMNNKLGGSKAWIGLEIPDLQRLDALRGAFLSEQKDMIMKRLLQGDILDPAETEGATHAAFITAITDLRAALSADLIRTVPMGKGRQLYALCTTDIDAVLATQARAYLNDHFPRKSGAIVSLSLSALQQIHLLPAAATVAKRPFAIVETQDAPARIIRYHGDDEAFALFHTAIQQNGTPVSLRDDTGRDRLYRVHRINELLDALGIADQMTAHIKTRGEEPYLVLQDHRPTVTIPALGQYADQHVSMPLLDEQQTPLPENISITIRDNQPDSSPVYVALSAKEYRWLRAACQRIPAIPPPTPQEILRLNEKVFPILHKGIIRLTAPGAETIALTPGDPNARKEETNRHQKSRQYDMFSSRHRQGGLFIGGKNKNYSRTDVDTS